jgi:hypothetical protein
LCRVDFIERQKELEEVESRTKQGGGEEENQFELNYFLEHTQSNTRARRNGFLKKENVSVQRSGRFFSARFHRRRRPPREDEEEEVAVFLSFFFLLLHVVVVVVVFFPSS